MQSFLRVAYQFKAILLLVICSGFAMANNLPQAVDPGAITKEIERREQRLEQKELQAPEPVIEEAEQTESAPADTGPSFVLKSLKFSKSEHLSEQDLKAIVKPYLGQSISFADLQKIVDGINQLYRSKGIYTATALLPQQQIEDGVVSVRLVEGKLGKIQVQGNDYTSDEYVLKWLEDQKNNTNVDVRYLEQDIQIYNRVNDQRLQASLKAGESFGQTDIVIDVSEPARNTFQLFADNYGYESSGEEEIGLLYQRQKTFIDGDRSVFYTNQAKGSASYSVSYNAPIKDSRFRVGVSTSYSETEVVEGDFAQVDVDGDSIRFAVESSYLAYSAERFWVSLIADAGQTWSTTEVEGVELSKYELFQTQFGPQLTWFGRGFQISARQTVVWVENQDELLDKADQFTVLKGNLTAIARPFPVNFYGLIQSDWQFADRDGLSGASSYSLGGPASIRGYDPGFVSGDDGYYIETELHYDALTLGNGVFDTFIFYDFGQVRSLNPDETLAALGAGFSWNDSGYALDFTLAKAMREVVPNQDDWAAYGRVSVNF